MLTSPWTHSASFLTVRPHPATSCVTVSIKFISLTRVIRNYITANSCKVIRNVTESAADRYGGHDQSRGGVGI